MRGNADFLLLLVDVRRVGRSPRWFMRLPWALMRWLKRDWTKEYDGWRDAAFDDEPIVYVWADGVHSGLRSEDDKLCALVIIGVTARGKKRFLGMV